MPRIAMIGSYVLADNADVALGATPSGTAASDAKAAAKEASKAAAIASAKAANAKNPSMFDTLFASSGGAGPMGLGWGWWALTAIGAYALLSKPKKRGFSSSEAADIRRLSEERRAEKAAEA